MAIYDIFSKRQKRLRGEFPDVYQYETIPNELRVQVVHIWYDAFGEIPRNHFRGNQYLSYDTNEAYKYIHATLCREYGLFRLGEEEDLDFEAVYNFFLETQEAEKVIDVIEVSFQYITQYATDIPPEDAIDELNHRFQEHSVGYQYESGQIIRIDSQWIHSEVVKPALSMLSDPMYEGANDEFLKAHEHYRTGDYKECLNECLKAFESCIKSICDTRGWVYNDGDTISPLIAVIFNNELIPSFMDSHFTGLRKALDVRKGLRSALESGVPPLRNKLSGHGQGREEVIVPEYMAAYALHLTASNILLLAKANEEMEIEDSIPF